jgi:ubiquitin carboxyl-terminal hydrolase 4/11/15
MKCIPIDLLEQYKDKKIDNIKDSMIINLNIEPFIKIINNYENNKQDEPLLIYDNFEIIEQKILKYYVDNYKNENLLSECIFIDEKIIVNLPNYLNKNKYISLIGCMDEYYNNFILDYILIYNNENDRKIHIQNINQNFNLFLNEIKFSDKFKQINYNNISLIIIKYDKDSNDINNNDGVINKNKLIENFKSCPKIGLQNIGATCYMNATLQCFCHIEQFVEYFKYNTNLTDIVGNNKNLLSTSFKILIDELWPDNFDPSSPIVKKYYSPDDFKAKISKMNPLFEGIAANDSKDLVNFIILTLHIELNKVNEINEENNDNGIIDQTNKELIYNTFLKEIIEKNNSFISELFYVINFN